MDSQWILFLGFLGHPETGCSGESLRVDGELWGMLPTGAARCNSLKENGSCWEIVDLILVCLLQIRLLYKSLAPTLRPQVVEGAGRTDSVQ